MTKRKHGEPMKVVMKEGTDLSPAPAKEFKFEIESTKAGWFSVVRIGRDDKLVMFRTNNREKADAWLQVYLTLSLPDRRKLREACA